MPLKKCKSASRCSTYTNIRISSDRLISLKIRKELLRIKAFLSHLQNVSYILHQGVLACTLLSLDSSRKWPVRQWHLCREFVSRNDPTKENRSEHQIEEEMEESEAKEHKWLVRIEHQWGQPHGDPMRSHAQRTSGGLSGPWKRQAFICWMLA